jgi:F0F1-type ATP synthase membrane subunit b/b'
MRKRDKIKNLFSRSSPPPEPKLPMKMMDPSDFMELGQSNMIKPGQIASLGGDLLNGKGFMEDMAPLQGAIHGAVTTAANSYEQMKNLKETGIEQALKDKALSVAKDELAKAKEEAAAQLEQVKQEAAQTAKDELAKAKQEAALELQKARGELAKAKEEAALELQKARGELANAKDEVAKNLEDAKQVAVQLVDAKDVVTNIVKEDMKKTKRRPSLETIKEDPKS